MSAPVAACWRAAAGSRLKLSRSLSYRAGCTPFLSVEFTREVTDTQMPLVAPVILPEMYKIFTMAEVRGLRPGRQPPSQRSPVFAAHPQRRDRVAALCPLLHPVAPSPGLTAPSCLAEASLPLGTESSLSPRCSQRFLSRRRRADEHERLSTVRQQPDCAALPPALCPRQGPAPRAAPICMPGVQAVPGLVSHQIAHEGCEHGRLIR